MGDGLKNLRFLAPKLSLHTEMCSTLTPQLFVQKLQEHVENCAQFRLLFKISHGGIVIRTIEAPQTEKPFFGQITDTPSSGFAITNSNYSSNLSPFQPIIHGRLHSVGQRSQLTLSLRPHPDAHPLVWVHCLAAVLLGFSATVVYQQRPEMAVLAALLAIGLFFFPSLRAQYSFDRGCRIALQTLQHLDLGWVATKQDKVG